MDDHKWFTVNFIDSLGMRRSVKVLTRDVYRACGIVCVSQGVEDIVAIER